MKKIVLVILLVLVTAGIGLLLYMLLTRTTPVYALSLIHISEPTRPY